MAAEPLRAATLQELDLERFTCALFDFDGVIADTEPLYMELDRRTLARFGYEASDEDVRSFIGHPSEEKGPALLAAHGIEVSRAEWCAAWNPDLEIYGSEALEPMPGLAELWAALDARGVRIAVVSSSSVVSVVRALNHFDLLRHVSAIIGSEMVGAKKPDPEPYLRALKTLGAAAAGAVAFDDSKAGVAAARAAGVYTVCFQGASEVQEVSEVDAFLAAF